MNKEDILKERAKILSKPKQQETIKSDFLEILVFKIANEKYGIETKYAKEVYPLKDYTPLPGTPLYIFGLINVRRKILAVINLKSFFGLAETKNENSKVIILKGGEKEFGLLTDGFEGIQKISISKVQTSLPTLTGIRQELFKGVTLDKIIIIDGKKLFSSQEIIVDEMVEL